MNRTLGNILGMISGGVGLIAIVVYIIYGNRYDVLNWVILLALIAGVASEVVTILKRIDFLPIISAVCAIVAGMIFAGDSMGTFVNEFNGIAMFGGTGDMTMIVIILVLAGIMALTEVVSCFMQRG